MNDELFAIEDITVALATRLMEEKGMDMIWYIWTAPNSPIYGRHKMATFERYFLAETEMHHESKNAYYKYCKMDLFMIE